MGWFFSNNNNSQNQNRHDQQSNNHQSFFQSNSSFYSKKRTCENDPENDKYLICKTIIKDNNGTREEEEKIPINTAPYNQLQHDGPFFNLPFRGPSSNGYSQEQRTFDKFPSFLIQPSFFDFHNSLMPPRTNGNQNDKIQSYSSSFAQSRSCHADPEDQEYIICKSKIYDGKQTKQVEQRLKISDQYRIPSFRGQLGSIGHEIDKQMHNLMKDINSGFNFILPFAGSFMNLINDLENWDKNEGLPNNHRGPYFQRNANSYSDHKKYEEDSKNRFFTSNSGKKDTNVYDL